METVRMDLAKHGQIQYQQVLQPTFSGLVLETEVLGTALMDICRISEYQRKLFTQETSLPQQAY